MDRIRAQVADDRVLAKKALFWVAFSKRPMSFWEKQHAVTIMERDPNHMQEADDLDFTRTEVDEDELPDVDTILSVCAGLIRLEPVSVNSPYCYWITGDSSSASLVLRFVHYSAHEYFLASRDRNLPTLADEPTISCTRYLAMDSVYRLSSQTHDHDDVEPWCTTTTHTMVNRFRNLLDHVPQLGYAREYLLAHFDETSGPPAPGTTCTCSSPMPSTTAVRCLDLLCGIISRHTRKEQHLVLPQPDIADMFSPPVHRTIYLLWFCRNEWEYGLVTGSGTNSTRLNPARNYTSNSAACLPASLCQHKADT
ncbi:hypothetical protein B0T19DRAFT_413296 [Cercophora scortea]|uniref:Uncharacterized protein n=1 Tax=Cercophora scortea TaxID=314031 RepID=A0AAE0J687_9PEZI|nr:hypothetical protein B0T19DRAFT_413296 [Cercophora scortea]